MVGDKEGAEDITQEVFLKVWKNLEKFDPETGGLKTWIFAIARNAAIDSLRKKRNIVFSELDSEEQSFEETLPDKEPLPDEIFERKNLAEELANALSKIKPELREIVLLKHIEEMTFEKIGQVVGKPMDTVKTQYRRALNQLRGLLRI